MVVVMIMMMVVVCVLMGSVVMILFCVLRMGREEKERCCQKAGDKSVCHG